MIILIFLYLGINIAAFVGGVIFLCATVYDWLEARIGDGFAVAAHSILCFLWLGIVIQINVWIATCLR